MSNDVSFANTNTKTDLKFNAYMAGRIPMNRGMGKYASYDDVTIAGLFQQQGLYQQMDLDVLYHRIPFELGIGYRDGRRFRLFKIIYSTFPIPYPRYPSSFLP